MYQVLLVDDDVAFGQRLKTFLDKNGCQVELVHSANSAMASLDQRSFDLVLTDFKLPDFDGLDLIQRIKEKKSSIPIILITNYSDIRIAVNSIKLGAYEFVTKPVNPEELMILMNKAFGKKSSAPEKKKLTKGHEDTLFRKSQNPAMMTAWEHLNLVAPTKLSVVITGESGTGKEYVARLIHSKSKRASGPFVAIDCGALSKELAASELFGHVKGAFTGASQDKKGLFETAKGGTLFLDEVGNLPADVQIQLLRALQERTIRKVGGSELIPIDVRILCATNENLESEKFRGDLYHRLKEFEIHLPPLRQRLEDLKMYCDHFLDAASGELEKDVATIAPEAMERFVTYSWPGNLRELKNIILRASLLATDGIIGLNHIPPEIQSSSTADTPDEAQVVSEQADLKALKQKQEKEMIEKVLRQTKYNKSETARLLNIHRKTLYEKLKQYGIDF